MLGCQMKHYSSYSNSSSSKSYSDIWAVLSEVLVQSDKFC